MGEVLLGALLGIPAGLVGAYAFIHLNGYFFYPKIHIVANACKATRGGTNILRFKVVNRRNRQAIGIKMQLHRGRAWEGGKDDNISKERRYREIPLVTEERICLEPVDCNGKRDDFYIVTRTTKDFWFKTPADDKVNDIHQIFNYWTDVELRLRVLAKDPIYQVERVYTRTFRAEDVVYGDFEPGNSDLVRLRELASNDAIDDGGEEEEE